MPYPSRIDTKALPRRALAVAEELGWEAWTLRDVAGALGVTANALYRHAGGRDDLVVLMGVAATHDLAAALDCPGLVRRVLRHGPRDLVAAADDAVRLLSLRYLRFAQSRPTAYDAFIRAKPPLDHPGRTVWTQLWRELHGVVELALPEAADSAGFTLWAFLHGRVELSRGIAFLASPQRGYREAVAAFLDGYRAAGAVPSPLPPHVRLDSPP